MKKIISILLIAVFVFTGCGGEELTENQYLTESGWVITYNSSETAEMLLDNEDVVTYEGDIEDVEHVSEPTEGYQYVIINVDLESTDDKTDNFDPQNFKLVDNDGNEYNRISDTFLNNHGYSQLAPSTLNFGEYSGDMAFEVPINTDLSDYTLVYEEVYINI